MNSRIVNIKKMKRLLFLVFFASSVFIFQGCEKYEILPPEVGYVSFSETIQPIFNKSCVSCHSGSLSPDLSAGSSYISLTSNGYLNTDTPEESLIYQKLTGSHKGYTSSTNVGMILTWITEGAPND